MRKPGGDASPTATPAIHRARKLVVPIALTVAISTGAVMAATTALGVIASAGCDDDDGPPVDAAIDTPLI